MIPVVTEWLIGTQSRSNTFRTIGRYKIDVTLPSRAVYATHSFFHQVLREQFGRKVNVVTTWAFRNTKKAGRSEERVREKVGSFSRSTPMLFLPFVRITSPVCSPPTRARTPTLVRLLVHVKICCVCAHVRIMRTRIYYTYTYTVCVCVRATSCALDYPPVHPLRKLGVVLSR